MGNVSGTTEILEITDFVDLGTAGIHKTIITEVVSGRMVTTPVKLARRPCSEVKPEKSHP